MMTAVVFAGVGRFAFEVFESIRGVGGGWVKGGLLLGAHPVNL